MSVQREMKHERDDGVCSGGEPEGSVARRQEIIKHQIIWCIN